MGMESIREKAQGGEDEGEEDAGMNGGGKEWEVIAVANLSAAVMPASLTRAEVDGDDDRGLKVEGGDVEAAPG